MRDGLLRALTAAGAFLGVVAGYFIFSVTVYAVVIATETHLLLGVLTGLAGLASSALVAWAVTRMVEISVWRRRHDSAAVGTVAAVLAGLVTAGLGRAVLFSPEPGERYSSESSWFILVAGIEQE